ncbi:hypothetical protein KKA00_05900 [bacterium]|nr:hypothetical protein [bacterium]MBU1651731.1 hypothetical protein [bacterium]
MGRSKTACLLIICGLCLLAGLNTGVLAQGSAGFSDYLRSGSDYSLGILDPSRMSFSHNIQSSYMSSGGQSVMRNMFMETIGYQFNAPVTLTFNVGYMHEPYSSISPDGFQNNGQFLGSAAVTWRPKENMFFHLEVANFAKSYYGYPYGMYNQMYAPYFAPRTNLTQPVSQDEE